MRVSIALLAGLCAPSLRLPRRQERLRQPVLTDSS
jgi:hypothetical protein